MTKLERPPRSEGPRPDQRLVVARAVLAAGGGFATAVATILGVAGRWHIGDQTTVWALLTLCLIVAITMFVVAYLMNSRM
jgi:hypothetical protein